MAETTRKQVLLEDYEQLNEDNQYILLSECHDLLKAQQLHEKHKGKLLIFKKRSKANARKKD